MSFLFKKVAAQDVNSDFIIEHSRIPIAQLGGVENAKKSGYIVAKKNGRTYGVHIDGYSDELTRRTLKDAGYTFDGCAADSAAMDARSDIRMTLHADESQIAGVVNVFTNHAVDKTAKEIAAIDELKGVIGIIHKVASVF